jgi:hypothetical protein
MSGINKDINNETLFKQRRGLTPFRRTPSR